MHRLNYSGQESKKIMCSFWFWCTSDLEIRSRSLTWYELPDPNQGYDHEKFERPPLNSVRQKADVKVFVKSENMSIISLEYVKK